MPTMSQGCVLMPIEGPAFAPHLRREPLIPDPSPLGAGRREHAKLSSEPRLLSSTGRVPLGWRVGGEGKRLGGEGRFILGIGSGWNQRDYEEYGYEFGTAASRLRELDRDMPVIVERLAKLNPRPVRDPFPILIGGSGEKVTLRIVAQYATIWNGQGEPEELARKNQILDEWCAKVGRDPSEIERSAQIVGEQLDKLDEYLAAGITHLIGESSGPDYDLAPLHTLIAWRDGTRG
jgi:hypothetical protein